MYDKRYSLALKTGCFLLLLVALVVGVAGGAAACYLADQGAYTISREDMLEMGLQERCGGGPARLPVCLRLRRPLAAVPPVLHGAEQLPL